jgi:hypothetical protein
MRDGARPVSALEDAPPALIAQDASTHGDLGAVEWWMRSTIEEPRIRII